MCGSNTFAGANGCDADVVKAARDLVNKMEQVHDDPQYRSVWQLYAVHGGDYSKGIKYDKEFAALKTALKENDLAR